MNDWNHWESLLRSWTPRGPSAKLRQRIFAPGAEIESHYQMTHGGWRWLAPVLGCLLLGTALLSSHNNGMAYLAATGTNNLLATLISNRSGAAYLVPGFHSERNAFKGETFEWTNNQGSFSSMGSFPLMITNSLIR